MFSSYPVPECENINPLCFVLTIQSAVAVFSANQRLGIQTEQRSTTSNNFFADENGVGVSRKKIHRGNHEARFEP